MRFLRVKEEAVNAVVDRLEADLADTKQSLEELEAEYEGIERRVTEAALAGDAEEFVAAKMRGVALPVLINRADLAVVEAELAVVGEEKRPAVEERQVLRARHDELHAKVYFLSRPEREEYGKVQFAMNDVEKNVRAVEEHERQLSSRKAELEEAARDYWPVLSS